MAPRQLRRRHRRTIVQRDAEHEPLHVPPKSDTRAARLRPRSVGQRPRARHQGKPGLRQTLARGRGGPLGPRLDGQDAAGRDIKKDLVYVLDIVPGRGPDGEEVPYTNSAGTEGEGWFAVQDVTVIEGDGPPVFAN